MRNLLTGDTILKVIDEKLVIALILLDLSKSFDGVNHVFLLKKLSNFGGSTSVVKWFESYLIDNQWELVLLSPPLSHFSCHTPGSNSIFFTLQYLYKQFSFIISPQHTEIVRRRVQNTSIFCCVWRRPFKASTRQRT